MTDIEFDQIRQGQTVRAHCLGGYSVEGAVIATGGYLVFGNAQGSREIRPDLITRVELLSEPAPKWEVGQLAEIDAAYDPENTTTGLTVYWDGRFWTAFDLRNGRWVEHTVTSLRLLKAVPAGAVVLPTTNPATGRAWIASDVRSSAQAYFKGSHLNPLLNALADAIEEAQR